MDDRRRLRQDDVDVDVVDEAYGEEEPEDGVKAVSPSSRSSGRGTAALAPGEAKRSPFLERQRLSTRA